MEVEEKPVELDLIVALQHFVKFVTWDHTDADYYLKGVKGKLILSMEDQNAALTQRVNKF